MIDPKDMIIKELLSIVIDQLDCRKAKPTHPALVELLKPTTGEFKFEDGLYQGLMIAGVPNGEGRTTMDNGDIYTGFYLHGKKSGHGIYLWSNGDVYEGEHLEGHEHGKGIYKYADGDIYAGDYRIGKRHGYGHLKLSSGTIEYAHFK